MSRKGLLYPGGSCLACLGGSDAPAMYVCSMYAKMGNYENVANRALPDLFFPLLAVLLTKDSVRNETISLSASIQPPYIILETSPQGLISSC